MYTSYTFLAYYMPETCNIYIGDLSFPEIEALCTQKALSLQNLRYHPQERDPCLSDYL